LRRLLWFEIPYDMYVQEKENMAPADPDLETKILDHWLMQQELKRQRDDLEFLGDLNVDITLSMIAVKENSLERKIVVLV